MQTMTNKRLYVDFHIIQTVPPSCVNRDDTGRPKTAVYGGVNRARVSSQAWKHAMRSRFLDIFADDQLGFRTKYAAVLIAKAIQKRDPSVSDEDAEKLAAAALTDAGIKVNDKKGNVTGALFFISSIQADRLAELKLSGEKDKKAYKAALKEAPSIDLALFGRMAADDNDLNVDACAQVAHSISTHAIQNEYDYFTAVDDYSQTDNAGAGHLGTMEFNSATLYRYATVNAVDLFNNIGADTADAVKGFADAFIRSMPTGKQNSYANKTLPDMVYVTIRTDQPVNLSGAFEKAVRANEHYEEKGYVEKSEEKLFEYAQKIYSDYCGEPVCSFVIGHNGILGAEKVNINELLEKLHKYISGNI